MPAVRLERRAVPKVWGRRDALPPFGAPAANGEPLGEIWFVDADGQAGDGDLLVKYLFTSERLSIQVHPDDAAARAAGHRHGKDEAWIVLQADPGATIGLGLRRPLSRDELRAAALDGRIERLVDWRPVDSGQFLYSPAGTIHALGAGLVVVEIQQNIDLTYRLYDYGRPRELHLDLAIAAARREPSPANGPAEPIGEGRERLAAGPALAIERWQGAQGTIGGDGAPAWLVPLSGVSRLDGTVLEPGSVWLARETSRLSVPPGADLLLAFAGRGRPPAPE
ncbi:MAG: class I mannose-6-phosphate isomerase [Allosphingosinicella sp.]